MTAARLIRTGILVFWAGYFTLVLSSNAADAMKALGMLPGSFAFASGNYDLMHKVTRIYSVPDVGVALLFAGVLLWQATAAVLFWRAAGAGKSLDRGAHANAAFGAGAGLWAAFILADELLIAYEVAGLESTHVALLVAQLVSLLAYHSRLEHLLPESGAHRFER